MIQWLVLHKMRRKTQRVQAARSRWKSSWTFPSTPHRSPHFPPAIELERVTPRRRGEAKHLAQPCQIQTRVVRLFGLGRIVLRPQWHDDLNGKLITMVRITAFPARANRALVRAPRAMTV